MYYVQRMLSHELQMEPQQLGKDLKAKLHQMLRDEVEGTTYESLGVIVAVISISQTADSQEGMIEYETGSASFILNFDAILYRPFRNEVIDAKVYLVNYMGIRLTVDLPQVDFFIPFQNFSDEVEWTYNADDNNFSDNAEEEDGPTLIQKNSIIRFRVLNVNLDSANCIEVFSTMSDDYLGVLEDPSEFD